MTSAITELILNIFKKTNAPSLSQKPEKVGALISLVNSRIRPVISFLTMLHSVAPSFLSEKLSKMRANLTNPLGPVPLVLIEV